MRGPMDVRSDKRKVTQYIVRTVKDFVWYDRSQYDILDSENEYFCHLSTDILQIISPPPYQATSRSH